jgi:hypothetical protein
MPAAQLAASIRPWATAWSPTPSTMAVKVRRVKPSTRVGLLASA